MTTNKGLIVSVLLIVLFGFLNSNANNDYQEPIDYPTTTFGYQPSDKGLILDLFNMNQKIVHQKSVPYSNSNQSDLITPILDDGTCFLIQSTNQEVNDRILNLESGAITDLGSRGHFVVAENQDAILLAKYEGNQLGLVLYDKKKGTIIDTGFHVQYPDTQGIVVQHGLYAGDKWYIPYLSSKGTFVVIMHNGTFTKLKISGQDLSDLWILGGTNAGFEFYSGYVSSTNPNSLSIMEPEMHDVYLHNGSVSYVSNVKIVKAPLGENSNCIGYVSKGDSNYLMFFSTQGVTKFETVSVDSRGESKRIFTSPSMDVKSVKINNSIIAVAGSNAAFFMNQHGNLVRQISRQ